jgi:hypothetical protein
MITNKSFYCNNKDCYPPFKNGLYLEECFLNNYTSTKRKYIPCLWTNFQIEHWFGSRKQEMQNDLDQWVRENPSDVGYFTVVQYDDGVLLKLPPDTIVYGSCSGDVPIPLIYEDNTSTLEKVDSKTFAEKSILCSFVGTTTHPVRNKTIEALKNNPKFKLIVNSSWTPVVSEDKQCSFIETTVNSRFALAPRGYGRSSFRFFEIFKLKTIPVYVWDDIEWLPFKETIDYSRLCISININEIDKLESILENVSQEDYNSMLSYYNTVKEYFDVYGMTKLICSQV